MSAAKTFSDESYFAGAHASASDSSLVSTPNGSILTGSEEFVSQAPTHPLPAHARDFPKPAEDVNVSEALAREPGRWTILGQREANRRRELAAGAKEESKDARAKALEKAKNDLLAVYALMPSKSN